MSHEASKPKPIVKVDSNDQSEEIYGYSEEAMQLSSENLLAESSREQVKILLLQLQLGKKMPPCESWRRRKDRLEIKFWLTVSKLFDEAGKPAAIAFAEHDLS